MKPKIFLKFTESTFLKTDPRKQASELPDDAKASISKGTVLVLKSWNGFDGKAPDDGHIQFELADAIAGKTNWHVFQRHAAVLEEGEDENTLLFPAPEIDERTEQRAIAKSPKYLGKKIHLPTGETVYADQPIIKDGSFSWGEATHGAERIPTDKATVDRIVKLAKQLEVARQKVGKSFRVTSWYRPEPFNSKAGGARKSQHLTGGAVDIVVAGMSGKRLAEAIENWNGGMGVYPGNRKHILHLDIGEKRKWGF